MSEPFIGEIRMFAGNFAPRSWALCDGQLLSVSQNDALFSLFGTIYGGDGRTTFGLPDLRGRIPLHQGQGPALTSRRLGQRGGAETHALNVNELPTHSHVMSASVSSAGDQNPAGNVTATSTSTNLYGDSIDRTMRGDSMGSAGGGQAHANVMPFLCVNFIVALAGIYPSRT